MVVLLVRLDIDERGKDLPDASAEQRRLVPAVVLLRLAINVGVAPLAVERVERVGNALQDGREPYMRRFQLGLRLFAWRDVEQGGQCPAYVAGFVEQRGGVTVNMLDAAVCEGHFVLFAGQGLTLGGGALKWKFAYRELAPVLVQPVVGDPLGAQLCVDRKIAARIGGQQSSGRAIAGDPPALCVVGDKDADG